MQTRETIQQELREAGTNLQVGLTRMPFSVPESYFENLSANLLARVRSDDARAELAGLSPLLAGLSRKMPFTVPQDFFAKTVTPETTSMLDGMSRVMPYRIPAGYFEELPAGLLQRVAAKPARVVSMPARTGWMRIAAAAVVAGALAIGGWLYQEKPAATGTANTEAWVQKRLNNMPDQALEEFIQTTAPSANSGIAATTGTRADVRKMLHDVPDNEMDAFLDQIPADEDSGIN
jgi:hypothetical protein